MHRRMFGRLLLVVLPLALVGAAPMSWSASSSPAKGGGTLLSFPSVDSADVNTLQVLLFNLQVRPGRPEYPPSPCMATFEIRNAQGDVVFELDPLGLAQGESASPFVWEGPGTIDTASILQPAVQLAGANGRSCSGVTASIKVSPSDGAPFFVAPIQSMGTNPRRPSLNTTPLGAHVLAPFEIEPGQRLSIVVTNSANVVGHAFPPSPCLPAVQFFGSLSGSATTEGESLLPGDSLTFQKELSNAGDSGVAEAVVLAGSAACRSLSVTAEIQSQGGDVVLDVPVLGNTSALSD
ncbi:MAG: hypothetical protein WBZ24_08600 [Anaerolineales bacterium]